MMQYMAKVNFLLNASYQLMLFPDVIFFDAVGTLFGVKGSVGQIYGTFARKYHVDTDYAALDRAFFQSFKIAPKMAFPDVEQSLISKYEYAWWHDIAKSTFMQAGMFEEFLDFEEFFQDVYEFFAEPDAWYIYEDVIPVLETLHDRGIELGVISNFDRRLYPVLESLKLNRFFTSITISTEVGAAKPDPQIFQAAIAKHQKTNSNSNYWHIGDSYKEDYEGAIKANLVGIWLDRNSEIHDQPINPPNYIISSMRDLKMPQAQT
jgi:putative hydrolase of the HAD superfamily